MRTTRRGNLREWTLRARHHAPRLQALAEMGRDIFSSANRIMALKSRVRIYTPRGAYIIRPLVERGQGYTGLEIKRFGDRASVRLRVI